METRKKKSFKRLFAFLMAFVMVTSLAVSAVFAADPTFKDVPASHEFYDYIEELAEKEIISGYGGSRKGYFGPEDNLTRAQAAKVIALAADIEASKGFKSSFTDITAETDLADHIWALEEREIVKGWGTSKEYRPAEEVERGHFAKMVVKAFGLAMGNEAVDFSDLPEDEEVAEAIKVLASRDIVKGYGSSGEFRPDLPIERGQVAKVVSKAMNLELEIIEASAIGAKEIELKFNKAVDTAKASITVSKNNIVVNLDSVEYSADKASAVLETTIPLAKGTYTVTVTGLTDEALVATFVVADDEKVAAINVLTEIAPMNPNAKTIDGVGYDANQTAFVRYEVLNQYGEEMTGQAITWTQSTGGKIADDTLNSILTIGNTASAGVNFIPGSKVYLTGVHGTTATVVNAEVTIGLESKAAVAVFKGVYDTTTSKLVDLPAGFLNERYVLLYEVYDQYDNKMDAVLGEFTVLSDNPLFVAQPVALGTDVTLAGVTYKALKLVRGTAPQNGGIANIQLVSNNTGRKASFEIKADALSALNSFALQAPGKLVAGKEKVEIPFEASDQYGKAVTKYSALNGNVNLSVGLAFEQQQDGSAKLHYIAPSNTGTADRIDTLTSLVPTSGSYSNIQLTVKPDAEPKVIVGLSDKVATSVADGNSVEFVGGDLLIQDQYGRTLTKAQVGVWLDEANNVIMAEKVGTSGKLNVSTNAVASSVAKFLISADLTPAGAATVSFKFSLSVDNGTTAIATSSKSIAFTAVAQSAYVSYEVDDLGTMYNNGVAATKTHADYDIVPEVYGVTGAGTKVLLPASLYEMTTTAKLDVTTAGVIADLASNGYVKATDFTKDGAPVDIPVKITFHIKDKATGASAATIVKDLVVSNADPVATKVVFEDDVVDGSAFIAEDIDGFSADELKEFIYSVKDQYGVANASEPIITISNVDASGSFVVTNNRTANASITGAEIGDTFTATFAYAGGVSVAINFEVGY